MSMVYRHRRRLHKARGHRE